MNTQLTAQYPDLRRLLEDHGIHLCYNGILTEAILTSIGGSLRHKLELEGIHWKVRRSIFSAFVEQVQNVIRYSARVRKAALIKEEVPNAQKELVETKIDDIDRTLRCGSLAVGTRADGIHFVTCSNVVFDSDVIRIRGLLDDLRYLNREALMVRIKETLKQEIPLGSKGAGVGLLTIAREATGGIDYEFDPIDAEYGSHPQSFFTITANF